MTKPPLFQSLALCLALAGPTAAQTASIRIAEADSLSGEDLVQLIAYENARERGVEIEVLALNSDDIAFQAVLNGQADIGVGDSYQPIANLEAPIRNFYQARKLAYVPVVDTTRYQTWQDLDGEPFAVHSRGSGTEVLARIMEVQSGITFSEISFVPGSEVRIVAMQRGNIAATYLDLTSAKILVESDPARFGALPVDDQDASDSTFYASAAFLEENAEAVQILVEELIASARATSADPAWPAAERERLGLLEELTEAEIAEITPYYEEAVAAGIFPTDGGGETAATADLAFLAEAGDFAPGADAPLEDFWTFAPLEAAIAVVGAE